MPLIKLTYIDDGLAITASENPVRVEEFEGSYEVGSLGANDALLAITDEKSRPVFMVNMDNVISVTVEYEDK